MYRSGYKPESLTSIKFFAYIEQAGEGCDYTIGCGCVLYPLKAQTYEEALKEIWDQHGGPSDRDDLVHYVIIEAAAVHEVPDDPAVLAEKEDERRLAEDAAKAARRAEFERLKKEFGE